MTINRTNLVLAVLLLVAVVFAATIDVDRSRTNFEFLPQMKRSAASNAWSVSTVFPNGRTMQAPVPGTIARGDLPLHYAATKEDAVRAGEELQNPFALDAGLAVQSSGIQTNPSVASALAPGEPDAAARLQASVQRGADVYGVFCVSCHGTSGAGDGPVAKRGFPPPPPLPTGKSVQMKDGQLFHILSYGQGSMAPMAAQLSRNRRWDVINFVRSLQKGAASSPPIDLPVPAAPIAPLDPPVPAAETQP